MGQELFLISNDLRERVRVQYSVLVLVRKTGSDGLVKQRGLLNTNPLSQIVTNQEQFLAHPH